MQKRRFWVMQRRMEKGLTQVELARKCGCSSRTINSIERGERHPSKRIAENLVKIIGGDVNDL